MVSKIVCHACYPFLKFLLALTQQVQAASFRIRVSEIFFRDINGKMVGNGDQHGDFQRYYDCECCDVAPVNILWLRTDAMF